MRFAASGALGPPPQRRSRSASHLAIAPLVWASEASTRRSVPERLRGGGDALCVRSVSRTSAEASCSHGTPKSAAVSSSGRPFLGSVALDARAVRASMASAQLRWQRRCLARSERVHRVRIRLLRLGNHRVRRHDVGNTPNPKTAPQHRQSQSSSTRLQPCAKSRVCAGLDPLWDSWYRAFATGVSSPPPGHAGLEIAFSHHRVTGVWSILRSMHVEIIAQSYGNYRNRSHWPVRKVIHRSHLPLVSRSCECDSKRFTVTF